MMYFVIEGYNYFTDCIDTANVFADDIGELQRHIGKAEFDEWTALAWFDYFNSDNDIELACQRVPGDLEVMQADYHRREAERLQAGGGVR